MWSDQRAGIFSTFTRNRSVTILVQRESRKVFLPGHLIFSDLAQTTASLNFDCRQVRNPECLLSVHYQHRSPGCSFHDVDYVLVPLSYGPDFRRVFWSREKRQLKRCARPTCSSLFPYIDYCNNQSLLGTRHEFHFCGMSWRLYE